MPSPTLEVSAVQKPYWELANPRQLQASRLMLRRPRRLAGRTILIVWAQLGPTTF